MGEQPAPPVIGRGTALGELQARVSLAADGSPSVVLVSGEAGVGKTRLVQELVASDSATVCAGACLPLSVELPFGPLVQALRGLGHTGAVRQQVERSPDLARLLPTWTGTDTEGIVSASTQLGLFQAVLELFERLGAARPVILVIEDLHWADRSTLDLLRYLATNLTSERLVLLATYEPDAVEPDSRLATWLAEVARLPLVRQIRLEPLSRNATASPLAEAGGASTLPELLRASVDALPAATRVVLEAAAVLGRPAGMALLARTLGTDQAAVDEDLQPALDQRVVVRHPDDTVGFTHPAFVKVVYGDLLPATRAELHRGAAEALESQPGRGEAGELARHWLGVGDYHRALDAAVEAGAVAEEMYAFGDAVSAYTRAVELAEQVPDSGHDLGRLMSRAAQAAHLVGDSDHAVRLAEQAFAITEESADRMLLCERLGSFQFIAGHGEQAREWYERALELRPDDRPSALVAKVYAGLALLAVGWSRNAEAEEWARRGLAITDRIEARREEGLLRIALGTVAGIRGDFEAGIAELRVAVAIAEDVGAPDDLAIGYVHLTHLLGLSGRLDTVAEANRAAGETLTRMGMSRQLGSLLRANACEALIDSGRLDEAEVLVAEALSHEPPGIMAAPVLLQAGRLAMLLGDLGLAWDRCEQARLVLVAESAPAAWLRAVLEGMAEIELWSGRPEAAYELVHDGLDLIRDTEEASSGGLLVVLGYRALADEADRRHHPEAHADASRSRQLLDRAVPVAAANGLPHQYAVDAWMAAEADRLDRRATPEQWCDLATAWTELGRPVAAAYARWREAETRLAGGVDAAGIDTLHRATAAARALRADPLVHELNSLARWHQLDLVEAPVVPSPRVESALARYGLTEREFEVLEQLAAGRTNREIAEDLVISSKTASVHVSNILRKLEVSGRQEAARLAHGLGVGAD